MKPTLLYGRIFRVAVLLFFIGLTVTFLLVSSPEALVESIGVKNSYAIMFLLALLGGMTTFSAIPYHPVLILFAGGGLDPLALGMVTAAGVTMGDATSYFVGYVGAGIIPAWIQRFLSRFREYCTKYPRLAPVGFFLYASLVPLSNDFIVISMGIARYPFWKVSLPLAMGNIVFNVGLAFLAAHAFDIAGGFFDP